MLPTYHYPYLQSHVRARTSGARRLAGLLVLACAPCLAMPILSFEYVGSGLTVSPTDLVVIEGLLENIGDTDLPFSFASSSFKLPQPVSAEYYWAVGGLPKLWPALPTTLAAGASIIWTVATLQPYPIGGLRGDPVAVGDYFLGIGTISGYNFSFPDPITFQLIRIPVLPATSNFVWTVADSQSVPEPGSLALMGVGLIALLVRAQKLRKVLPSSRHRIDLNPKEEP